MVQKIVSGILMMTLLAWCGLGEAAQDKDKKKAGGTIIGEVKSKMPTPNGKNVIVEVLAPGEVKARSYRVNYDPKVKGPIPAVLEAVKAAKIGDRVQFDWIDTGEGLGLTAFQVLNKGDSKKE